MIDRDTKIFNKEAALLNTMQAMEKIIPDFEACLLASSDVVTGEARQVVDQIEQKFSKDDFLLYGLINEYALKISEIDGDWFSLNDFQRAVSRAIKELIKLGYTDDEINQTVAADFFNQTKLTRALNKPYHLGLS